MSCANCTCAECAARRAMPSIEVVISGCPVPKGRARMGKGYIYTPQKTREYEKLVAFEGARVASRGAARDDGAAWLATDREERYETDARIYYPDARTRDNDNVYKSLADGSNKVLWYDDKQIKRTLFESFIDRENPRVEMTVRRRPK